MVSSWNSSVGSPKGKVEKRKYDPESRGNVNYFIEWFGGVKTIVLGKGWKKNTIPGNSSFNGLWLLGMMNLLRPMLSDFEWSDPLELKEHGQTGSFYGTPPGLSCHDLSGNSSNFGCHMHHLILDILRCNAWRANLENWAEYSKQMENKTAILK